MSVLAERFQELGLVNVAGAITIIDYAILMLAFMPI